MWILDLILLVIVGGGVAFWYHILKRNVVITHQVVQTDSWSYPFRVKQVIKFFGKVIKSDEVAYSDDFQRASAKAVELEKELKQKLASKTVKGIYDVSDLEKLLLEQSKDQNK